MWFGIVYHGRIHERTLVLFTFCLILKILMLYHFQNLRRLQRGVDKKKLGIVWPLGISTFKLTTGDTQ